MMETVKCDQRIGVYLKIGMIGFAYGLVVV